MVLLYFTINDEIMKKSLDSLAKISTDSSSTSPIIVGGIAVQLHCQNIKDTLRPTSDVDVLYMPPIDSFEHFEKNIGGNLLKDIKKKYQVQLKRIRDNYEVKIMNGQGNKAKELFFIHFDNLSPELSKKSRHISDRESENALIVPYNDRTLYIKRIEDILPHKIKRMRKIMTSEPDLISGLEKSIYQTSESGKWSKLARIPLQPWLDYIIDEQNGIPEERISQPGKYVFSKDLYDVCLLSRHIECKENVFNRAYYLEAKRQIDSI